LQFCATSIPIWLWSSSAIAPTWKPALWRYKPLNLRSFLLS